jgi:hypothetical protein
MPGCFLTDVGLRRSLMTFTSWLSDGVFDPGLVAVFHFIALVDEEGHVTTVIDDELGSLAVGPK